MITVGLGRDQRVRACAVTGRHRDGRRWEMIMDPNKALAELREAISIKDYEWAAMAADTLDGWLTAGGFLPDAWSRAATTVVEAARLAGR